MKSFLCALLALVPLTALADEPAQPTLKVGATIFADATWPTAGAAVSSFNVPRAYINVTGTLSPRLAFRITPDVARESGSGSSLSGSQQFRLKYAYAQLNLDEQLTKGSWMRFGMQQTPFLDATEGIYRYRFQGTLFPEREGYLMSSDNGLSLRYALPKERGELHAGVYNGEGYSKSETNDHKSVQLRATYKPAKGVRTSLFVVGDANGDGTNRSRVIAQTTYEHKRGNAGADVLVTRDGAREGRGWSAWATPKLGRSFEVLLRHDDMRPDQTTDEHRQRNIVGLAYWMRDLQKVTYAIMADYDALAVTGTNKPDDARVGLKMLLSF